MNYQETQPARGVDKIVKCYWALEYDQPGVAEPELVLPDGCPEIVFNLAARFVRVHSDREEAQPSALLAGQISRSIMIRPSGRVKLFGVRLQPAGAFALVRFSLDEITDNIVEFGHACGREGRELEERLNDASSFTERVSIFENWVTWNLSRRGETDRLTTHASMLIAERRGSLAISEVADRMGTSERRLERHFKRSVGISPKAFSRIMRFQSLIRSVQNGSANLLDAALGLGYYDQSHLIRDFQEFSGITPKAFFDRSHQISDVFTGGV